MTKPPTAVTDFPSLIRWLAEQYHHGTYYGIAAKLRCAPAAVYKWRDGMARPTLDTLTRICKAYRLDFAAVSRLVTRSLASLLCALTFSSPLAGLAMETRDNEAVQIRGIMSTFGFRWPAIVQTALRLGIQRLWGQRLTGLTPCPARA